MKSQTVANTAGNTAANTASQTISDPFSARREPTGKWEVVWFSGAHAVTDFYMNFLPPLLPFIVADMGLSMAMAGLAVSLQSVTSSLLQPVFGHVIDRRSRTWVIGPFTLIWTGLMSAAFGFVNSYFVLLIVAILSGVGAGAIHPLGASLVARSAQRYKGLGISIYSVMGNLGYALTPVVLTPLIVGHGRQSAAFWVPLAVVYAASMWFSGKKNDHINDGRLDERLARSGSTASMGMRRGSSFISALTVQPGWIYVLNFAVTLRSWVHSAVAAFLVLYLAGTGRSEVIGGRYLFGFLLAGSAGVLVGGFLSDRHGRRLVTWASLFLAGALLIVFLYTNGPWSFISLILSGAALMASFPVTVAAAQEASPSNAGMVSGLMMGFAYGIGGLGVSLTGYIGDIIGLRAALGCTVALLFVAGLISVWLPLEVAAQRTSVRHS